MEVTKQCSYATKYLVPLHPVGVWRHGNVALDRGEHIPALAVRAELPRRTVEAHRLQVRDQGPDQRRVPRIPRSRTARRLADPAKLGLAPVYARRPCRD